MTKDTSSETVISRWSRRKQAQAEDIKAQREEDVADAEENTAEQLEANRKAAEAVDLDMIDKDTDFSVFFKKGVPISLRKQALSALWRSDPMFANLDGLVEYGEDFANPELIMKAFESAWQVGRGYAEKFANSEPAESASNDRSALEDPVETEDQLSAGSPAQYDDATDPAPGESREPDTTEAIPVADSDRISVTEEAIEPAKISLRRRLMLDGDS